MVVQRSGIFKLKLLENIMNPIYEGIVNTNTGAQVFLTDLISVDVYSLTAEKYISVEVMFVDNSMTIIIGKQQSDDADFIGSQRMYDHVRKTMYLYLIELSLICDYTESITNTQSTLEVWDKSNYTLTILKT